jgi:thiamine-monophosphate kinase
MRYLAVGTDFIRGPGFHLFKKGLLTWNNLGRFLVAANLSDLAAMGATPIGLLLVVRYTSNMSQDEFESLIDGVLEACDRFRAPLLGGDMGGYDLGVLSATALGVCSDQPLLRSNGCVGDKVFLSQTIGSAGAALAYFLRVPRQAARLSPASEADLLRPWQSATPEVDLGMELARLRLSTCAIDTSDGLKASCRLIAEASGVDVVLRPEAVPIARCAIEVATILHVDPLALACGDSPDFRLLFTVPASEIERFRTAFRADKWRGVTEIGELRATKEDRSSAAYIERNGILRPIPGVEWDQDDRTAIDRLTSS